MTESTNLNIRIDKELKEQAERFFGELGLNMSSAFNIFVRQSLRQGKIPFEISLATDPFYSRNELYHSLQTGLDQINNGDYIDGEEYIKKLNNYLGK
ncbi:MAG: type II toxin-antitoxin system RelB/DinJ family antitoxin [Treponema sp.]|nr:type II toxin-antitoxin system RelB/DinJ family antitoxin [Treponema sp.]MCL2251590.1 type II toxin-antitoxin system RelB/DinJ family antitoxin [Treponema sp.]